MKYYQAIVLLIVTLGVLSGVSLAVSSVDVETISPEMRPVWEGIVYIFTTSAATPAWVFIRNVYGYAKTKWGSKPEDRIQIEYEAHQFTKTYLEYEGYIKGYMVLAKVFTLGTPLEGYAVMLAGAFSFITDLIRDSLADLSLKISPPQT